MTPTDKTTPTVERIVEAVMKVLKDSSIDDMSKIVFETEILTAIATVLDEKVTDEQLVEILAEHTGVEDIKNKSFLYNNWTTEINAIYALRALRAVRDRCARPEWVKDNELQKALKLYGRHLDNCDRVWSMNDKPCSCGLTDLIFEIVSKDSECPDHPGYTYSEIVPCQMCVNEAKEEG